MQAILTASRKQAFFLLLIGILFLITGWLLPIHPSNFPAGILFFGLGTLLAALLNPKRLLIPGSLFTALGVAVFLIFKHWLPGNQTLAAFVVAIGIGLLALVPAVKRGYVGPAAISPGVLVLVIGLIEVALAAGLTPSWFIAFMLSLWFPGIALVLIGAIYFVTSRGKPSSPEVK
jgi:hypothetical protein